MRFLCDQMLGTLAKWLRILGYDVYFANNLEDDEDILRRAEEEERVIITRDKYLVMRAKRRRIKVIEIESKDLDEQLKIVTSFFPIDRDAVLSRCSICNSLLVEIDKNEVKGKVPDRVYEIHDEFWYCKNCKKIYWKGSHWNKMKEKIDNLS